MNELINLKSAMTTQQFKQFYQTIKSQIPKGDKTVEEIRRYFAKIMSSFPPSPEVTFSPIKFGKCEGVWIKPPKITSKKVLLFFHGGAYIAGSWETHQDLLSRLALSGEIVVCSINYRLAPEHPFPAALEDALEAYLSLSQQGHSLIIGGSSAGGGLALAVCLKLKQLGIKLPAAGILLSPWVDLSLKGATLEMHDGQDIISRARVIQAAQTYLAGHNAQDPLVSPIYGDLSGLPPLLIQAGTVEILWSEIEKLVQEAVEAGVSVTFEPYEGMIHTWQLFAAEIPEGAKAIQAIGAYIKSQQ